MPALTRTAHCASASDGASMTGKPMRRNSFLHSSLCLEVTCTVRFSNFTIASLSPSSFALSRPSWASFFFWDRFTSSPLFNDGALPSNTKIGFTPCFIKRRLRDQIPRMWLRKNYCYLQVTGRIIKYLVVSPASLVSQTLISGRTAIRNA